MSGYENYTKDELIKLIEKEKDTGRKKGPKFIVPLPMPIHEMGIMDRDKWEVEKNQAWASQTKRSKDQRALHEMHVILNMADFCKWYEIGIKEDPKEMVAYKKTYDKYIKAIQKHERENKEK